MNTNWSTVCNEEDPDLALSIFISLFMPIAHKHAPLKKINLKGKMCTMDK